MTLESQGVDQAEPIDVGARQHGPEGATEDVGRAQDHERLDAECAAALASPVPHAPLEHEP